MKYSKELGDRKVMVTGANGFIGSNLVDLLLKNGSDVVAFARAGGSRLKNLQHVRDEIDIVRGDLQDPAAVRDAVQHLEGERDVLVFHLGAQAHVGDSWGRPHETLRTNVIGTLNLLEALRDEEIDVAKINVAGSSEEYGRNGHDGRPVVLDESSSLDPKSIYATSKVAQDFLGQNYHDAYDMPVVTTRMFNNYGPRQSPRYITGTVITQALERERIELGNLEPERDMSFVEDGVRGHLHATLEGNPGEVYTFGQGSSVSMREWTEKIIEIGKAEGYWGDMEIVQTEERFRPGNSDVRGLKADYSKLEKLTGWKPEIGHEEGLRRTIEWYARNEEKWLGLCDWR